MNVKRTIWVVVVLIVSLILGALGRGNWGHQVLSIGALLWLGLPLLIAGCVFAFRRQFTGALLCIGLAVVIALQLGLGMGFLHWDIYRGQQYCESLVPILDEIYLSQSSYPLTLDAEPALPPPPSWQFDTSLINYYSDGMTFSFEVTNPAELFGGFIYRHDARQWEEWRD